ncbi:MAG: PEP-CTERM sorting domain-containing protein [Phycisphaeraceae bacterium]|nr:PEP-CTERM sorting domain-containing protein [Phycisphaeraceae bacterium]
MNILKPTATVSVLSLACLAASPAGAIEWHAWGVHGATISSPSAGTVDVETGSDADYHWNKSSWSGRTGKKAFYSTNDFLGQTIGDITQITWDVTDGSQGDVYFNIMVDDGDGDKGILIPSVSSSLYGTAGQWGDGALFRIVEADAGFDPTLLTVPQSWDDVKDLVITTGPFNDEPDNLAGAALAQGGPVYDGNNWAEWADAAAGSDLGWEQDGLLIVFGQSTGNSDPIQQITGLTVVPEPTSLALLGLGGLLVMRRRR